MKRLRALEIFHQIVLFFRLQRQFNDRIRDPNGFHSNIDTLIAVAVSGGAIDANHSHNVSRHSLIDVFSVVGIHLHDATNPLLFFHARVPVTFSFFQSALIDSRIG